MVYLSAGLAADAATTGESHTFLGLGIVFIVLVLVWLIRRSNA